MSENQATILAVDDNADVLFALEQILLQNGYAVDIAHSGEQALEKARLAPPSAMLVDIMMPFVSGYELTKAFRADPKLKTVPIIYVSSLDGVEDIVRGLDEGGDDYVRKPYRPEELLARLRAVLRTRSAPPRQSDSNAADRSRTDGSKPASRLGGADSTSTIIGTAPRMKQVFELVKRVARADSPVLVTGPSGSGKELVARAIHDGSRRKDAAFIAKNCAAFQETLAESELFGYLRGAFTGANKDTKGLFDAAHQGTLFLDEVGELSLPLQAKLLRVLQEGTFQPVGSIEERKVDVRLIAATNRDLQEMVANGAFREDLFYRLNVICVELPPLVERREDIPLLVQHFLDRLWYGRGERGRKSVAPEALRMLEGYSWRGNIRELENEIERMLVLGHDQEVLGIDLLSPKIMLHDAQTKSSDEGQKDTSEDRSLLKAVEQIERRMIEEVLISCGWNKSTAAKQLGISRSNLIAKVQRYQLEAIGK